MGKVPVIFVLEYVNNITNRLNVRKRKLDWRDGSAVRVHTPFAEN